MLRERGRETEKRQEYKEEMTHREIGRERADKERNIEREKKE